MRLLRPRVEEVERLDAAIAATIQVLEIALKLAAPPNFAYKFDNCVRNEVDWLRSVNELGDGGAVHTLDC